MNKKHNYVIGLAFLALILPLVFIGCTPITPLPDDKPIVTTFTLTYSAGVNGSITGTTPQTVKEGANGSPITATANTGYHFTKWSDGKTANPRTDTNVQADITVSATFEINQYQITYTAGSGGSITGETNQTVNHGSSSVQVITVPNAGYHFTKWSDGRFDNKRSDTNITKNISVVANFEENTGAPLTLKYSAGPNGSITGDTPQAVYKGANGEPIKAVPNDGYHFTKWSDGKSANPRTDTNVQADITVSATFEINPGIAVITVVFEGIADEKIDLTTDGSMDLSKKESANLSVTVAQSFDSYTWYVDGAERQTGTQESMELYAGNLAIGSHTLLLVVQKNGVPYSKQLFFRVTL